MTFQNSSLDQLPSDWQLSMVKETCEKPQYGYTETASSEPVGPIFLRITDIQDSGVNWDTVPYCVCDEEKRKKFKLEENDILVARIGATTGKSFLIRKCPEAVFASYLIRLRAKSIDPEFLYYYLNSENYWRQINANKGDKLKGGVNASILAGIQLARPPLAEQRAIASVLAKVQARIEAQRRIVAALKELKAATMAKLFREGTRGERLKQTEIGEIPESWEMVRLGDYCTLKSGGTPSRQISEYWGGAIPWVKTGEINYEVILDTEEKITQEGLSNSSARVFPKGTLLMAMYGQGVTRGRVAILGVDAATNQACVAFFPEERITTSYLYAYFCHAYNRIRMDAHGANQQNLSADLIANFSVPIPQGKEEQSGIAGIIKKIEEKTLIESRRMERLQSLFSSLLHLLMTGQVRVMGIQSLNLEKESKMFDKLKGIVEEVSDFETITVRVTEREKWNSAQYPNLVRVKVEWVRLEKEKWIPDPQDERGEEQLTAILRGESVIILVVKKEPNGILVGRLQKIPAGKN